MGRELNKRIDIWKKLLLDFVKRNRLINFKEGKRSNVCITAPSYDKLFDLIAVREKDIRFPYARKTRIDDEGEEMYDEIIKGDVETSKPVGELQKTLKVLRYRANTSIEEQGINILFLAFGLLKWSEREDSEQTLSSPIVLVPVKLTIESLTSPYKLEPHEDEIVVNPTLRHKLDNDFGIKLPEFDESQDDITDYLDKTEQIISKKGWKIERCIHLTNLSFLKINMYKDLERNKEKLNSNPIITAIAGEHEPIQGFEGLDGFDHDKNVRPIDTFQVVDADSSQQDAILLSKRGVSFVLQGPPGTGKSQTITNIISEAIADGKKVLFVSEKMAALQVVYNRLVSVGLGDFCFTLHSHKANKKEILRELAHSISIDRKKVTDEALTQLHNLERKRANLNEYQQELHTPCSGLNKTIFEINGRLAKLSDIPEVIFGIENIDKVTTQELDDRLYLLRELSKTIGKRNEDYADNVWRNSTIKFLSNELRHDIDSNISILLPLLSEAEQCLKSSCDILDIFIAPTVYGLESIVKIMELAKDAPNIPTNWLINTNILSDIERDFSACRIKHEEIISDNKDILQIFDKEIFTLDFYPILHRYRNKYQSCFRVLRWRYWADKRAIKQYLSNDAQLSYDDTLRLLNLLKTVKEKTSEIESEKAQYISKYDTYYKGVETNWNELENALHFAKRLHNVKESYKLTDAFTQQICSEQIVKSYCQDNVEKYSSILESIDKPLQWFSSLFDGTESFRTYSFTKLADRLTACKDKKYLLEEWVDYCANKQKCENVGLLPYIVEFETKAVNPDYLVDAYLKRFYRLWLDAMLPQFPAVLNFRGRIHEQTINEFRQLDKDQFKIAQARVRERVVSRIPDFNAVTSTRDEIGILKRELNKQRRLMPLRKLFMAIPNLITSLRPCFMMSPLSVSVFLEAQSYDFDLVIFDEASQVHTEDAIGAIMRGKQVIIVGDTQQLPPTNFFASSLNDEDFDSEEDDDSKSNDAGAYDSILEEAVTVLPERSLRWHYRSRHEHLIAFSNIKIYKGSLITFPASIEKAPDYGVEYIYVSDGVYDRSGKRNNVIEARKVADLVFEHFRKYPNRSLGVVTFSEAQQNAVDAAIRQKRYQNAAFERYFVEDKDEPFFIKNLENVQGDERDTIIFSIGYAKDAHGIMYMNFGPLSRDGGYRRLNVAITRAKYNVKLVGSIVPTDIDVDKTSSEGVRMLRSYIEFAQNGITALEKELTFSNEITFDSPFEESVYDFLQTKGYNVVTQVGCSGFRIDMAIKHPVQSGCFVIGIECDGATYHSSRTARERDRLRQTVLEDMGWTIYRIWSTDWIKDQRTEEQKLVAAVERALGLATEINIPDEDAEIVETPSEDIIIEEPVEILAETQNGYGFIEYQQANIYDYYSKLSAEDIIKKVIEIEQPIHFEELCRRVAPLYGNYKATSKIRNEVQLAFKYHLTDAIKQENDFITLADFNNLQVRIPSSTDDYIRPIVNISDDELALAMSTIVEHCFGIAPEDLFRETARVFGFKRTGENIVSSLRRVYNDMLTNCQVREVDGKVNNV